MNATVACPACGRRGTVDIRTVRIRVLEPVTYGFDCPHCGADVIQACHEETVLVLARSGVRPPIDEDDVAAFGAELAGLA